MRKHLGVRRALSLAAALAFASAAAHAATSTVDFEAVTPQLYTDHETIADHGFNLTVLGDFGAVDTAASCFIATCPTGDETQFYQGFNDSHVALARGDGQAFQLLGFDAGFIAPLSVDPGVDAGAIRLRAVGVDGQVYDRSFSFRSYGSGTSPLSGMGWLHSVEFFACTWDADGACSNPNQNLGQFALDNIALQPVPEPATTALLALGLGGLVLVRNRRQA
jgi:hypothetical protein